MLPRLLSPEEAAGFLRRPRKYVLSIARAGKLEAYRVGRQYRFTEEQLLAYLRSSTTATRRPPLRTAATLNNTGSTLTERDIIGWAARFLANAERR